MIVIPRIFHRGWFGPNPMPALYEGFGQTWRDHHPDWQMILWTDENLPDGISNEALASACSPVERANLVRYEALRSLGGVWVDTDFECLRPIEPLLEDVRAFVADIRPGRVATAVMGAVPHHALFERLVMEANPKVVAKAGLTTGVSSVGIGFVNRLLREFPDVTIFGPEKFYPYDWYEKPRAPSEYPEAYAIHHWGQRYMPDGTPRSVEDDLREEVTRLYRERAKLERRLEKSKRRADKAERKLEKLAARLSNSHQR